MREGDGHDGWPEHAPFDAIVVTAAVERAQQALFDQMKPDGHMVIPVGPPWGGQELQLYGKIADGRVSRRRVLPVAVVPFRHAAGGDG